MLRNKLIAPTVSAIVAAVFYTLVQYVFNRRFELMETVIFAVAFWLVFFFVQILLYRQIEKEAKPEKPSY